MTASKSSRPERHGSRFDRADDAWNGNSSELARLGGQPSVSVSRSQRDHAPTGPADGQSIRSYYEFVARMDQVIGGSRKNAHGDGDAVKGLRDNRAEDQDVVRLSEHDRGGVSAQANRFKQGART